MIALNPHFASLLVALTASVVGAAPTSAPLVNRGERNARIVLDVNLPPVEVNARTNVHIRSAPTARHHQRKDDEIMAVYVARPRSDKPDVELAPIHIPTPGRSRRSMDGPIDSPDSGDEADYSVAQFEGLGKRSSGFKVHSEYGPGLIITPLNTHQLSSLAERGLLDSLLPILGSLPGIGGIITLIGGTLKSVLGGLPIVGPVLGNLLLSVHPGVESIDGSGGAQFFLDASSSRNSSTIYLVDSGRPSQLATSTLASDSPNPSNSTTSQERIVSLQMAFINSTSGAIQAFCATYDSTGALAARPCLKDGVKEGPDASQAFGYNPSNGAVRPMWGGDKQGKRDYVVQASEGGGEKEGDKSVVLVFKPLEAEAGTNSTSPAVEPSTSTSNAYADPSTSPDEQEGKDGEVEPVDGTEPEDREDDAAAQGVPVYVAATTSSA